MPPVRESSITVKYSEYEAEQIGKEASRLRISVSEYVRCCISIGGAVLNNVDFASRVRLEDNELFAEQQ